MILNYQGEQIIIHWYKEAKAEIMRLAKQNAGDLTLVAKGGRGRNKCEYYNYPCSFDIETTTIKPGELDYIGTAEDPPIAFPYLFQWNIYGSVIMCRHYHEALEIFSWISEYFRLANNRKLVIFDHNLGYEHSFFRDLWDVIPDRSFALDEHHPVTIYTEDGFIFRDSYKMTNMGLESLTKDWSRKWKKNKEIMDYSQLRTPYTELDDNTLIYSALDVLSLSDAIEAFLAARSERIWTNCPTSTSFIRKELKARIGVGVKKRSKEQQNYWKWIERQRVDLKQYSLLQRLARGGNTHANRRYTGQLLKDLCHFDITSSYPAQMVCYPEYPLGEWAEMDPGSYMDTVELFEQNGYCCMVDVTLINPRLKEGVTVPYISISKMVIVRGSGMQATDNGRYISGLEAIQLSIFGMEWPIIKAQYDFDDAIIVNGYFCRKGYLPDILRNFILELYAKKTQLKGIAGQEVEYALAKTYVNGVFGMAYTSPLRDKYEFTGADIILADPGDPARELEDFQGRISDFLPYSAGAVTACAGRVFLQKMIDAAGEDFVYCDTDSIFALHPEKVKPKIKALERELTEYQRKCGLQLIYQDIKGRDHELGSISEEDPVEYFKTYGAKKYITVENGKLTCTIAGVPKNAGSHIISRHLFKKPKTRSNFRKGAFIALKRKLSINLKQFQLGLNFKGKDTGKNCLWYNPAPHFKLHDEQGREIEIYSNVAMLPCDYLLSLSQDYRECLSIEGNFHWNFKEALKNTINEEDL